MVEGVFLVRSVSDTVRLSVLISIRASLPRSSDKGNLLEVGEAACLEVAGHRAHLHCQ